MNNTWGVIGGGFGLYGYLPVLVEVGVKRIFIHKKNIHLISSRDELRKYLVNIEAIESYETIFNRANSLIIATPPSVQECNVLEKISNKYKYLLLEKPLGVSPSSAEKVYEKGVEISDSMRVGYTFLESQWAKQIRQIALKEHVTQCVISWQFDSYHHRNNINTWKADHNSGGGALRFYGIQLIAIIAILGEVKCVEISRLFFDKYNDAYCWIAKLEMKKGGRVSIELNSQSKREEFQVSACSKKEKFNANLNTPFDYEVQLKNEDIRIAILSRVLRSFSDNNSEYYKFYSLINKIWTLIESNTEYIKE